MTMQKQTVAHKEVNANYEFFKKMLPEWQAEKRLTDDANYALLHHQKLVDFFESEKDAIRTGVREYGWGEFSVQAVNEQSIDLGFQAYAIF